MVFEFLDRFFLACLGTNLSEIESFLILKEVFAGKALSL